MECPFTASSSARFRTLLALQRSGDCGSPRAGSSNFSRSSFSVGSLSTIRFLPAPAQRTRPAATDTGRFSSFTPSRITGPRNTCGPRNRRNTTPAQRYTLGSNNQSPGSLIQQRPYRREALPDSIDTNIPIWKCYFLTDSYIRAPRPASPTHFLPATTGTDRAANPRPSAIVSSTPHRRLRRDHWPWPARRSRAASILTRHAATACAIDWT